jgi:hypothetical protein
MDKLPAGDYVISDPCYVLDDADYDRLLTDTDYFNVDSGGGVFKDSVTGLSFAVFSTAYGDGCYLDNYGRRYGVDAGCIACIPLEMLDGFTPSSDSYLETFYNPFEVYYNSGKIHFGRVMINTDPDIIWDENDDEW